MNVCAFCGPTEKEFTPEDIVPHWFSRFHKRARNNKRFQRVTYDSQSGFTIRKPTQRLYDQADDVVCVSCNGTWMSRIENDVKSILEPILIAPSTTQQLTDKDRHTL